MRPLLLSTLILPLLTAASLAGALGLGFPLLYLFGMGVGLIKVLINAVGDIRRGRWSVDYIAFLALIVSAFTHEWLAGAVIAFMYTGGTALEAYATRRAEASLTELLATFPKTALVKDPTGTKELPLADIVAGTTIIVHTGELVPLDGLLVSEEALLNLANLTGESFPLSLAKGAVVKSGSVNAGEAFELSVSGTLQTSTYAKIIELVKAAEHDQAPFVRLASQANIPFTLLTLGISGAVYLLTGDVHRVLAVLVIATPCPLIIAAPVAFIGGIARAARKRIIVKSPTALEILARVSHIYFDKTGTLTLGEPKLSTTTLLAPGTHEAQALSLAAALEFHSIHPLARAVMTAAHDRHITPAPATDAQEVVGTGITGMVDGHYVSLGQAPSENAPADGISLLLSLDGEPMAAFHFTDVLKAHAQNLLGDLAKDGYAVAVLTGDREENARATLGDAKLTLHANCSPEEKYQIVENARSRGAVVAMIGDGLNDAPALAKADVGIVFSGTENSASIEAASVAILGRSVVHIQDLFAIARRSVRIAQESVYVGITLSVVGMLYAAAGYIPPVSGAILQESIDALVILNALRTVFPPRRTPHAVYS
jgi:heavy metal translocating P-type ATPase